MRQVEDNIMRKKLSYTIGMTGKKWATKEKQEWLSLQVKKRDYFIDIVTKINLLSKKFDVIEYGKLKYNTEFPLYALKTKNWHDSKKIILITGGVHGYESSGVHGALQFAQLQVEKYEQQFNFIIVPCISPWGYEMIQRWNPNACDPNRSFSNGNSVAEAELLLRFCEKYQQDFIAHFDLHETTDLDESEFRPALAARDGLLDFEEMIPDGFYTVGDIENTQDEFQAEIIKNVKKVTFITQADKYGKIIDCLVTQEGVINYPLKKLNLCASITHAPYVTTTEVYPDNSRVTYQECNEAQVAAICGGLNYILNKDKALFI